MEPIHATKIFIPYEFAATIEEIFATASLNFCQFSEDAPAASADFVLFTERSSCYEEQPFNIILAALFGQEFYLKLKTAPSALIIQPGEEEYSFATSGESFHKFLTYPLLNPDSVGEDYLVQSQFGPVTFLHRHYELARNFEGMKMLCQQVGIYEETFYDALTL